MWFDSPEPPDPIRTASAATATNVSTAVANAFLNNTNQVTPEGALNFDQTSTYNWNDPTTGQTYSIPRFTATQSLSPQQQGIKDQTVGAQTNLAGLSNQQSGMLGSLLGSPYNPFQGSAGSPGSWNAQAYLQANPDVAENIRNSGQDPIAGALQHYNTMGKNEGRSGLFGGTGPTAAAPGMGNVNTLGGFDAQSYLTQNPDVAAYARATGQDPLQFAATHYQLQGQAEGRGPGLNTIAQGSYADVGGQQRGLGPYGSQQYTFGNEEDYNKARAHVEEALYQRMDPQLQRDRGAMEARLADQGIKIGSPAYQAAMDQFNRQLTDTRLGITQAGAAEQQQAFMQALGRGQFSNQAQMEQFQKQLQAGTFANQAQQQDYQQAALRGQFYNTAAAQNMARNQNIFNAQNQQRGQYIQEQQALRNQPINEITALLSGSQVSQPNWVQTGQNQIPTTDVAGLINNRFSQDMDSFKQQSANFNSLMGGIFGALGGVARSDRRFKDDIEKIGSVFAAGPGGEKPLPIYSFAYKDDPTDAKHIGPMAQDVEKIDKSAVLKDEKGMRYLDRTKLGSILRA